MWLEREVDGKEVVVGCMVVLARRPFVSTHMRSNDVIYKEVGRVQPHGSPTSDHDFGLLQHDEREPVLLVPLESVIVGT